MEPENGLENGSVAPGPSGLGHGICAAGGFSLEEGLTYCHTVDYKPGLVWIRRLRLPDLLSRSNPGGKKEPNHGAYYHVQFDTHEVLQYSQIMLWGPTYSSNDEP